MKAAELKAWLACLALLLQGLPKRASTARRTKRERPLPLPSKRDREKLFPLY